MEKGLVIAVFLVAGISLAVVLLGFVYGLWRSFSSVATKPYLSVQGSEVVDWGTLTYFRVVLPSGTSGLLVRVFDSCRNSTLTLLNVTDLSSLSYPYSINSTYLPTFAVVVPSDCGGFCVLIVMSSGDSYVLCSS